jgi:hypothetical protein
MKRNRQNLEIVAANRALPTLREFFGMVTTFGLTLIAWVFFRAESVGHALQYLGGIFSKSLLTVPAFDGRKTAWITLSLMIFFVAVEWFGRRGKHALEHLGGGLPRPARPVFRWAACYAISMVVVVFGVSRNEFIYFQF